MRLGGAERGIQTGLVDRSVDQRRGGAGGRERLPGDRGEPLGSRFVEFPLQREDVALQPGQQVQPGAKPGIRELWQVRMQVDQPGQNRPRAEVDGVIRFD